MRGWNGPTLPSGTFAADDTEFNIFNTDRKLSALEDASKKLGIFPEKKALIYFSSGVGKTGVENQSQIKATTNAAVTSSSSTPSNRPAPRAVGRRPLPRSCHELSRNSRQSMPKARM